MRDALKNFDWHMYGLKISDIDYTVTIVEGIVNDRINLSQMKAKIETERGVDSEGIADLLYYDYLETEFLWHYALIRLQGIFEGIIQQEISKFNNNKPKGGLRSKLKEMNKAGYCISQKTETELIEWGQLRNALAHFPPEQYRPGLINKNDVLEYAKLIKEILSKWNFKT